jgi:uncharacterized protein (TIGR02145 family)
MKKYVLLFACLLSILLFHNCKKTIPGKVEIISIENLTHNSMVVYSEMTDIQNGVGFVYQGICVDKSVIPVVGKQSFAGIPNNGSPESCQTGVSGLEPDTRYIVRAYFEIDEGIVYSDTMVIKTKPVDFMTDFRDGKKYPVKTYGNQVWMVQNLDYQTPASLIFENIPGKYPSEFGKLYTYPEAVQACPSGWRLPSDEDWKMLEQTVGIPGDELDKTALRGSPAGGRMKEPGLRLWELESASHSDNRSGFSVVPSGWYRTEKKEFTYSKTCAGYWTLSADSKTAFPRFFYVHSDGVSRANTDINSLLLSVRCIKY